MESIGRMLRHSVVSFAVVVPLLWGPVEAASFRLLVTADGAEVAPYGVSADGKVVVGQLTGLYGPSSPFRWTRSDGVVSLGLLPGCTRGMAHDVSADGSVVVGEMGGSGPSPAFRWTQDAGLVSLGFLSGGTRAMAYGVSGDGGVVVGIAPDADLRARAFRWESATGLVDGVGLAGAHAYGVSADCGVIVGGASESGWMTAYRHTASGLEWLGDLPGGDTYSMAWAVSPDGSAVVGNSKSDNGLEAFVWTADSGMVTVGDLPGSGACSCLPRGVSSGGAVVVGYSYRARRPFVWDATHGIRDLNAFLGDECGLDLGGFVLSQGTDITPDAKVIVGTGASCTSAKGIRTTTVGGWIVDLRPSVAFEREHTECRKGVGHVLVPLALDSTGTARIEAVIRVVGGTAGADDYAMPEQTVAFPPGERQTALRVDILQSGNVESQAETVVLQIGDVTGGSCGAIEQHEITILGVLDTIHLEQGWNCVSIPSGVRTATVEGVFGSRGLGTVWHWNAQQQRYEDASQGDGTLSDKGGYWVYANAAADIAFERD